MSVRRALERGTLAARARRTPSFARRPAGAPIDPTKGVLRMSFATGAALAAISALVPLFPLLAAEAPEGLRLEARVESKTMAVGEPLLVAVTLVNGSKSKTHPVVRPGDGSEVGWREPHVFWTVTRVAADGKETPAEGGPIGRCGLFQPDWTKDVTRLAPGESLPLEWMMPVSHVFDLQDEGLVRIVAHYAWRGGKEGKGLPGEEAPKDLGEMAGIAPYELKSNPVDVRIVRPLDVVAGKRADARVGRSARLSELLDLRVENRTGAPLRYVPAHVRLDFFCHAPPAVPYPTVEPVAPTVAPAERVVAAGGVARITPAETVGSTPDVTVTFAAPGVYRLAVGVALHGASAVRSNWVEVTVTAEGEK